MMELQDRLLSLSMDGVSQLIPYLESTNWLASREKLRDMLSIILDISNFSYRLSEAFTELCAHICSLKEEFKQVLNEQARGDLFTNPAFNASFPSHCFFYRSLFINHTSLINFDPIDEMKSGITPPFGLGVFQFFKEIPRHLEDMIIDHLPHMIEFYSNENSSEIFDNITSTHPMFMPTGTPFNEKLFNSIVNDDLESFIEEIGDIDPQFEYEIGFISHMWDEFRFVHLHRQRDGRSEDPVRPCDLSAMFGSIRIFKFLLVNGVDVSKSFDYAIAGGNTEIIRLISQRGVTPTYISAEIAYKSYQNEILDWILEKVSEHRINGVLSNNLHQIKIFSFKPSFEDMVSIELHNLVSLRYRMKNKSRMDVEKFLNEANFSCFITDVTHFICLHQGKHIFRMSTKPVNSRWRYKSSIDFDEYTWKLDGKKVDINPEIFEKRGFVFYGIKKPECKGRQISYKVLGRKRGK